jgi:hypothetical protein
MAIPTTEPAFVTAGDTVAWTKSLSDYSAADGWTLAYRLINAAGHIDITTTPAGHDHAVTEMAADTSAWPAGAYTWQAYVTKAGDRHTVGTGAITIRPNLAAKDAGYDARGTWAKTLDGLRLALATWLASSGQVAEYEIAGRRMKFATADDIRKRIAIAEKEVAREAAAESTAAGNYLGRTLYVRFPNA